MLYQLGRVCFEQFGTRVFIVQNHKKNRGKIRFHHQYDFPTISIYNMRRTIGKEDLFICNPVQSPRSFGTLLSSKKLMYLQGVTNYSRLDMKFDHYVSASHFIQETVREKYGLDTPVINPFINLSMFRHDVPWDKRSDEILILDYKKDPQPLLTRLIEVYQKKYPGTVPAFKKISNLSQEKWAETLASHKFYLTLSPVEGFGLPSLEAMASGCVVLGLDSYGGRDYFEPGRNALVVGEGDFDQLAEYLHKVISSSDQSDTLSKNAVSTAQNYSFSTFTENWRTILEKNVGLTHQRN
ncbi:MAG TPA: glycosyltransferase family 4 protein [Bacillales bacterium]|nr:glycosyltransferase family 4 protein [Bacillales bacterium]